MSKIPKTMSTQHPDNANQPFFVEDTLIGGEDEIQEAYYAYSHLGCDEQMWDFEGKEVDNFVVKKLLTKNEQFFRNKKLGRDVFLTLRVPNPEVEKAEGKILLETLESIPRSYDAARLFYGEDIPPIFEVILPMATSVESINRIYHYYKDFVAGKQGKSVYANDISVGEWIGEFYPKTINVIPLFEDIEHMFRSADIVRDYLKNKNVEYQRVFLARSDPAVNYGSIAAVLINKVALRKLWELSQEIGVPIYPILGAGSAPFRGNLRPQTVDEILQGYPSVHTFTIQSSFKFDNAPDVVHNAIEKINEHKTSEPFQIDEEKIRDIITRYADAYSVAIEKLAPVIHSVAEYIPRRRKRKLHIGLFGYSRSMKGLSLPRAITFTAAMYSIGLPPELLGLEALTSEDVAYIKSIYTNFDNDIVDALTYYNEDSPYIPAELKTYLKTNYAHIETNAQHKKLTDDILSGLEKKSGKEVQHAVLQAAKVRGFLG